MAYFGGEILESHGLGLVDHPVAVLPHLHSDHEVVDDRVGGDVAPEETGADRVDSAIGAKAGVQGAFPRIERLLDLPVDVLVGRTLLVLDVLVLAANAADDRVHKWRHSGAEGPRL